MCVIRENVKRPKIISTVKTLFSAIFRASVQIPLYFEIGTIPREELYSSGIKCSGEIDVIPVIVKFEIYNLLYNNGL